MVAPLKITPELQENLRGRYEDSDEPVAALAIDAGCTPRHVHKLVTRWGWRKRKDRPPRDLPDALRLSVEADEAVKAETSVVVPRTSPHPDPPPQAGEGEEDGAAGESRPQVSAGSRIGAPAFAVAGPGHAVPPPEADATIDRAEPRAEGAPVELSVAERLEREVERQLAEVQNLRARLGAAAQTPADAERTARTLASLTETLFKVRRLHRADARVTDAHDDDDLPRDIDAFRDALARRIEAFVRSRTDGKLPAAGAPAG